MAIQFLRGTKSKVAASTKVLADGQPLYEKDTNKLKVGDGSTEVKSLPYVKVDTDSELSSTSTNPIQNKAVNAELEKKLSLAGGTMTGMITTKGINLTLNTDYGTTLPSSPATDQLFFQTVGTNFVLDNVYPVGSIYMNVNSTNPETLFGGTWEQIQGRFLLGMSSSYPAGSQGGEQTVALTMSQMPKHDGHVGSGVIAPDGVPTLGNFPGFLNSDVMTTYGDSGRGWNVFQGNEMHPACNNLGGTASLSEGQAEAHNNMPPYLSVYIWKRTE